MIEAIHALVGAIDAGRYVPEVIRFIRTYPGLNACMIVVLLAGIVVAIFIRRKSPEIFLSLR
jgi:hypothetical protein